MSHPRDRYLIVLLLAAIVACGESAAPTSAPRIDDAKAPIPASAVLAARAPSQTSYALAFTEDLLTGSSVFRASAKSGDPFSGIAGDNVRILIPAATTGDRAVCDGKEASLGPTTNDWGAYAGEWTGTLQIGRKTTRSHLSYQATRAGGGYLNLDVFDVDTDASGLTLRLVNARGLVGATSRPDSLSPVDGTDRCLTFTVMAAP